MAIDIKNFFQKKIIVDLKDEFLNKGFVIINSQTMDLDNFEFFTKKFSSHFHNVGIRSSLKDKTGDGYTTHTRNNNFILLGHSEGMYRPYPPPPDLCFFMCVISPKSLGGETTFADSVQLLNNLPLDLKNKLITLGVIYQSLWEPSRWQAEFGVESENSLRMILDALPECNYSMEREILNIRSHMKAVHLTRQGFWGFTNGILAHLPSINHPRYSELPVYTNSNNSIYFGNGDKFSDVEINQMIDVYDQTMIKHRWSDGDILILDNMRFLHGRLNTEKDCERLILSRFGWLN
jgi:alpha-ketoglutarate-dependent taurine dioxygenase